MQFVALNELDVGRYPDDVKLKAAQAFVKTQEERSRNANILFLSRELLTDSRNRFSPHGWKVRGALLRRIDQILERRETRPPEAGRMKFDREHPFQIGFPKRRYDQQLSLLPKVDGKFLMDDDEKIASLARSDFASVSTDDLLKHSAWIWSKKRRFSHAGSDLSKAIRADIENSVDRKVFAGKKFVLFRMVPVSVAARVAATSPEAAVRVELTSPEASNPLQHLVPLVLALIVIAVPAEMYRRRTRIRNGVASGTGGGLAVAESPSVLEAAGLLSDAKPPSKSPARTWVGSRAGTLRFVSPPPKTNFQG